MPQGAALINRIEDNFEKKSVKKKSGPKKVE